MLYLCLLLGDMYNPFYFGNLFVLSSCVETHAMGEILLFEAVSERFKFTVHVKVHDDEIAPVVKMKHFFNIF